MPETTQLRKPTIHLNGTSVKILHEQFSEAYSKVGEAIKSLEETQPNGRDYYPQGEGALKEAMDQYLSRVQRLQSVRDELLELAMVLDT